VSELKRRDCPDSDTCPHVRGDEGSRACGSCNGPAVEDVAVKEYHVPTHGLVVCLICGLSHPVGTGYCTTYNLDKSWNRRHKLGVATS